jgi:iron transport multicopper oxidase
MDAGLAATLTEVPLEMQKKLSIPANHYQVCNAKGTQISGTAAGNMKDLLNLLGQREQVAWLLAGFAVREIVVLVFSCLAAIFSMATIFGKSTRHSPPPCPSVLGNRIEG